MKTLSASELMKALKQRREVAHDNDAPEFTSATAEERLEPSEMPSGQDNSILEKEGKWQER